MRRRERKPPATERASGCSGTAAARRIRQPQTQSKAAVTVEITGQRVSRGLFSLSSQEMRMHPFPHRPALAPFPLPLGRRRGIWHVNGTGAYGKQGRRRYTRPRRSFSGEKQQQCTRVSTCKGSSWPACGPRDEGIHETRSFKGAVSCGRC